MIAIGSSGESAAEETPPPIGGTIDLENAARGTWDAIVVGAGPAGALAARELALGGARTLLVDKATFPRAKVCGGCLNARSVAVLERLGLGDLPARIGALPTTHVDLRAGHRSLALPLSGGCSVSRETFDAALIREAIAAGASFLPGVRAGESELIDDGAGGARALSLSASDRTVRARARVLLPADGLGGKVFSGNASEPSKRSRLGGGVVLPSPEIAASDGPGVQRYRAGTIYMGGGRDGYIGVVTVEGGRLDVAGAFDPSAVRHAGGLGPLAAAILREAGLPPIEGLEEADWRGTPLLTRRSSSVAGERILALGDATGYVEPLTGEGMAWAMASAATVAPIALDGMRQWSDEVSRRWTREHRDSVVRRTWFCRTITGLLRSPGATRSALLAASLVPSATKPLFRWLDRLPPSSVPVRRSPSTSTDERNRTVR